MLINHFASPSPKNLSQRVFNKQCVAPNIGSMNAAKTTTADATRLTNLRRWVATHKKSIDAASALNMSHSQLLQIAGPNPTRHIGPVLARRIEQSIGKPKGWLDTPIEEPLPDAMLDKLLSKTRQLATQGQLSEQQLSSVRALLQLITETSRSAYVIPPTDIKDH